MNCFVIMPFAEEFDDVYVTIKASVVGATSPNECRCFRLDETRPAGRITNRLLQELRTASLCIADLTGNRPNVMWEVGYAMALECPTIILTQSLAELSFDIKDMQSLQYDRGKLSGTLGQPLQRMIIDTISAQVIQAPVKRDDNELVGQLLAQVADLKTMVEQAVRLWHPPDLTSVGKETDRDALGSLEGAWLNLESGSHAYAKFVRDDLVVPYCYLFDNELTGTYFGWRRAGAYWFAQYAWLEAKPAGFTFLAEPAGFTFLKQESVEVLRGAWWADTQGLGIPEAPPDKAGVPSTWLRTKGTPFPSWAVRFLEDVERKGLPRLNAKMHWL